ncbi:MAG: hypothetical protein K2X66_14395 [Cyanobacteria bacterium]|nr:hypothetical protein [Cyanobacteriota bacterium]
MIKRLEIGGLGKQSPVQPLQFGDRFIVKGMSEADCDAWRTVHRSFRGHNFILFPAKDAFVFISQDSLEKEPYQFYGNLLAFQEWIAKSPIYQKLPGDPIDKMINFVIDYLCNPPVPTAEQNKDFMRTFVIQA